MVRAKPLFKPIDTGCCLCAFYDCNGNGWKSQCPVRGVWCRSTIPKASQIICYLHESTFKAPQQQQRYKKTRKSKNKNKNNKCQQSNQSFHSASSFSLLVATFRSLWCQHSSRMGRVGRFGFWQCKWWRLQAPLEELWDVWDLHPQGVMRSWGWICTLIPHLHDALVGSKNRKKLCCLHTSSIEWREEKDK